MTRRIGARLDPEAPVLGCALPAFSLAAEQYRKVVVQLGQQLQAEEGDGGSVVTVTSPDPAAGKTLTSLNLALAFARAEERRVLLVECDLWQPTLHDYVGFDRQAPGVYQLLEEGARLQDVLISVAGTSLDLLTAGVTGAVENLVADSRMRQVVAAARSSYDVVIVDGPPFLFASAHSLAALADGVLIVVRGRRSRQRDIEPILASLGPDKVLGMILNDVRREGIAGSSYGVYTAHHNGRPRSSGDDES